MKQAHWIKRKRASVGMAEKSLCAEARLIHYELAGRYSVKAAQAAAARLQLEVPQPLKGYSQSRVGPRSAKERS